VEEMTNPSRPIDHAFAKIWECYHADQEAAKLAQEAGRSIKWEYSQTRLAVLAAARIAMACDDSINTGHYYPPNSNEIVVRLREIQQPTEENIRYAQEAVRPAMGWEDRLEQLIRTGAKTL
jgi:hypothetical protein